MAGVSKKPAGNPDLVCDVACDGLGLQSHNLEVAGRSVPFACFALSSSSKALLYLFQTIASALLSSLQPSLGT